MAKITDNGGYKYTAQELKFSTDGGQTWQSYNPKVYRMGDLVGLSSDCASIQPIGD